QRGTTARPGDHQQDRSAAASRRAADREHAAGLRECRLVRHRGAGRHAQRNHRQGVSGHEEGARYDRDESALLRAGAGAGRQFAGRVRNRDEGRDRALGQRGEGAKHPRPVKIDLRQVEEAAKELYIRALKRLPPDVKQGFDALAKSETDAGAKRVLGTMIRNIAVAEDTDNLLCQDTGIPIYNVWIGRGVEVDGLALKEAIRRGCERATREHPLRSSVGHPPTRVNERNNCGRGVPVIHIDFSEDDALAIEMIPKGSGSENNSWLRMAVPAEGVDAVKTFVVDCVLEAGGKTCPPTIVGVGVGGPADLCVHLAKVAATRPLGWRCADPERAKVEP